MAVAIAYPFVEIKIDTSALTPIASRAPGVIAIVGTTPNGANGGSATLNTPFAVDTLSQAAELFAKVNADGTVAETKLFKSIMIAMKQDPRPSKIYGVRVSAANYAGGLASLEAADDVTFVGIANEADPAKLVALKNHVENMSAQGQKRIGVAMVNPQTAKSNTYAADVLGAIAGLKSDSSRMVVVAARGGLTNVTDPASFADASTAAMSAIAGFPPHISMVLKKIRGVTMPTASQYSPSEIKALSEGGVLPIIDPALVVGESHHFAEGRLFTSDQSLAYIDIVRTLDDIEFRLKAGLIGLIGDARITKGGMTRVKTRVEGILGPLKLRAVIADFNVDIPVLDILSVPRETWSPTDEAIVTTARANRTVDMNVTVEYGPAVHLLKVTLAPKF